ncbi:MAG: tetratricopeptide repeat protein [Candidatus Eiseniibacteriota bacterium]
MPAGLVIAIGVVAAWMFGRVEPGRDSDPITALLERASAEGLVIPGGEAGASVTSPYRSGQIDGDDSALNRMRRDHERDPRSGNDLYRLAAGLVAAGRIDLGGDYVREGLARTPADPRLLTLAGIVAHRRGDPELAERCLREALRASPSDLTAMLDLGLVLAETHGVEQAAPYLTGVIRYAPRSPLADRARTVLERRRQP